MKARRLLAALFALVCVSVSAACPASARPGRVIAAQPERASGATVTSILYESTGVHGEPVGVSGFVIVPDGPPPPGGRPIVAWAHPTVGVASKCAPSRSAAPLLHVPGLSDMVRRGFIVVAPDYPGLGTPGVHPFLVGDSEGHAVLDAVRAARSIAGGVASNHFAVWGFSQGGHAALFAGKLARAYAPDLALDGVAVAEPATDLGKLIQRDLNTPIGKIFTSYTLYSWSRVYRVSLDPVLAPAQQEAVEQAASDCVTEFGDILDLVNVAKYLKQDFLLVEDISKISPWRELIRRNTPTAPLGHFPVFLAQGTLDQVVPFNIQNGYVASLCTTGTPVDYFVIPGGFHAFADRVSAPAAIAWIADRFAGLPPPNTCTAFRPM